MTSFRQIFFKVLNLRKLVWQEFEKDRTGHAREKGPPPPSFALVGVIKTINKSIKAEKEKLKEKMKEKIGAGYFSKWILINLFSSLKRH